LAGKRYSSRPKLGSFLIESIWQVDAEQARLLFRKLLKLLISKATESSRKRSINKRLEPAAVLRSTCPQMSVAKF